MCETMQSSHRLRPAMALVRAVLAPPYNGVRRWSWGSLLCAAAAFASTFPLHVLKRLENFLKIQFSIRFVTVLNEKTFSKIIVVFVFNYLSTNLWCLVFVELSIVVSWCDECRGVMIDAWYLLFVLPCFFHVSTSSNYIYMIYILKYSLIHNNINSVYL